MTGPASPEPRRPNAPPRPARPPERLRSSVGLKVALVLIGVQALTGCAAVALTAWFSRARSLELVAGSLAVQLDRLAEEIETRAPTPLPLGDLPEPLRLDLAARFADPVVLLRPEGEPVDRFLPEDAPDDRPAPPLPPGLEDALVEGEVIVEVEGDGPSGSYGLAPLYDADGLLAGGVLVQPLDGSVARELAGTRAAYLRSLVAVLTLALLGAAALAALVTPRLVGPLRRITRRVEEIEAGDYAGRLPVRSGDEVGRLAAAVNRMAAAVEHSIEVLRATDRLRRELVANVGHDLRTPLAALTGYLEETQRHLAAGALARAEPAAATAAAQAAYLRRLVDDLFELSVLDGPRPPLHVDPVPLAELLSEAARAHAGAFEAAGVAFSLDLPPRLPLLRADGVRLLRLLDNLLTNARQHTPPGGAVRLAARADDDGVILHVADTGRGMDAETAEHVFERHFRGTDARTRRADGTGLGLSIARAVARAHGGDLWVESEPGAGATFTLRLPLPPETSADGDAPTGPAEDTPP